MKAWRTGGLVAIVVLMVIALMDASDLVSYLLTPEAYTFGTEVGGFRYDSSASFLGTSVATLGLAAVGFAAPWLARSDREIARVRVFAALIAILLVVAAAW